MVDAKTHVVIGGSMVPFKPTLELRWQERLRVFEGGSEAAATYKVLQQKWVAESDDGGIEEWRDVPTEPGVIRINVGSDGNPV
jgi:hypothetical protein